MLSFTPNLPGRHVSCFYRWGDWVPKKLTSLRLSSPIETIRIPNPMWLTQKAKCSFFYPRDVLHLTCTFDQPAFSNWQVLYCNWQVFDSAKSKKYKAWLFLLTWPILLHLVSDVSLSKLYHEVGAGGDFPKCANISMGWKQLVGEKCQEQGGERFFTCQPICSAIEAINLNPSYSLILLHWSENQNFRATHQNLLEGLVKETAYRQYLLQSRVRPKNLHL